MDRPTNRQFFVKVDIKKTRQSYGIWRVSLYRYHYFIKFESQGEILAKSWKPK